MLSSLGYGLTILPSRILSSDLHSLVEEIPGNIRHAGNLQVPVALRILLHRRIRPGKLLHLSLVVFEIDS